ncbi:acyl carrier protein [Streptomyces sp. QL37]|uniref:acyl carrier protein n=1 Tax=Streptomyces sp. QL37 TaxID=2093747 RepID=UPI000CF2F357|nr:acyl carrier protein [Streptomyces sp. QL37]PPQ57491.1 actinorhodin polyketide synthase [Streptomyces sp. QL37]
MPEQTVFTVDALKQILRDGAGADESAALDGDILDTSFDALGYESLALLETASRIERAYDISLDEEAFGEAVTPRALIDLVNSHLPVEQSA